MLIGMVAYVGRQVTEFWALQNGMLACKMAWLAYSDYVEESCKDVKNSFSPSR
jgi:hypothetical protein